MIKDRVNGVVIYPCGREVCDKSAAGKREYKRRIERMRQRQFRLCCVCLQPLDERAATFEHEDGRGMGGGFRDDRIEVDGVPVNGASHGECNAERGSKKTPIYQGLTA